MDDIFLKIINREIPAAIIYEDDVVISFLDIKPNNKGHALVVPKVKSRNIFDIEPDTFAHMAKIGQKVAKALRASLGADGINITMNNESAAHQEVFHTHIHVIPRYTDDGVFVSPRTLTYEEGESKELAEKIKKAME